MGAQRRRPDLRVYYSKKERDVTFWRTGHQGGSANRAYMYHLLGGEISKELDRRGFDLTTIRFSISRKPGLEGCRECNRWPHHEKCSRYVASPSPDGAG